MKKTLSVILCAVMILSCIPFAVFAADEPAELTAAFLEEADYSLTGVNAGRYKISAGNTITVYEDTVLTVGPGTQLDVYGTLNAEGTVKSTGGTIYFKVNYNSTTSEWEHGTVLYPGHVVDVASGDHHIFGEVAFNGMPQAYTDDAHYVSKAVWARSSNGGSYEDVNINTWNNIWGDLNAQRGSITASDANAVIINTVPLGQYFYFRVDLMGENGEDKFDATKAYKFSFNTLNVAYDQGTYRVLIEGAGVINFTGDKTWQGDEKYLKRERIYLPSGSGYRVYGVNGEASENDQTVSLLYGREFTFRISVDKAYSESDYKVYCVNSYKWDSARFEGTLAETAVSPELWNDDALRIVEFKDGDVKSGFYCDENGIYHISGDKLTRECSIVVTGVAKNDTISMAGKIVELIKNVFATIKGFFEQLFGFLGK